MFCGREREATDLEKTFVKDIKGSSEICTKTVKTQQ